MRIPGTLIAVAVISTVLVQSAEAAHKDGKVLAAAQAARASELELLEQVVNIDSGTGDVEGGRKVAAVLIPHLKALGMTVESVPADSPGLPENTVATLTGRGKGRILMIGHIDTV